MGPKYINIEIYKSAVTTGRAQGCFFFRKMHFLDFPSLRRLPGVLKAVFSAKIALLGFSKPGGPYLGPYVPYGLLPRWGPWALLGPLFACFLMRRYG